MQHEVADVKREGNAFPCLQPPSAFFVTPSSGDTPQRPDSRRAGARAALPVTAA